MSQLLKRRLLQKRKQALRESVLMHTDDSIALENKAGIAADDFLKTLTEKKCVLVATVLDAETSFQMGLCNLDFKNADSRKVYSGMIAANIMYYATKFGVSSDKLLGDIAGALSATEQILGVD